MGIQEIPQWPLMSIREVAARSGVPASTLRFYEMRGLIKSHRNGSSHRHYSRAVLRLIAFIVFAQKIGYTLDEIAEQLVSLPEDTAPSNKDWQRLSRGWKQRVANRIEELQRLYINLDECIGCGCLSLKRCKLTNPEDRAGRNGPGARRWLGDKPPTDIE
ncbi:redox-sensitive transcriptional activator SoxR [Burkholderia lata]|uniref:redox-sensitive transcriptional activator SoxR n=1 Tax=Burkholderia lata (strain ATCC 17760 / DSM 23089 / LMG 22485 / NCIMB 9086 / R18194 / 383) TaxID=482957 RepID=UPI00145478B5|nr:redox-sensitive transcriptional activator SoxR [Burkholderia lata]VWM06990.1 MerR family transcriptional regulator [Burkholderia lata]